MDKKYYSTIEVGKILHISRVAVLKRIKTSTDLKDMAAADSLIKIEKSYEKKEG